METDPDAVTNQEWARDLAEQWGERALRWLLERDLEEPEEKLFAIPGQGQDDDLSLSAAEAELGARHMLGGAGGADELAGYIEEEIVLTSVGTASDIYASTSTSPEASPKSQRHQFITVEHSRDNQPRRTPADLQGLEGADVLGIGPPPPLPPEDGAAEPRDDVAALAVAPAVAAPAPAIEPIAQPSPAAAESVPLPAQVPQPAQPEGAMSGAPASTPAGQQSGAGIEPPTAGDGEPDQVEAIVANEQWSWCVPRDITFTFSTRGGGELFHDFLDAFLEEAGTELEKLEDALGAWERDIGDRAAADTVARVLHTIKGIAKGVGLQRYGTLIHNFETLLAALPEPAVADAQPYFRVVNAWLDYAVRGYDQIQATRADIASELPLQAEGPAPAATTTPQPVPAGAPRLQSLPAGDREQDRQLADEGVKVLSSQQTIRISPDSLDYLLNLGDEVQKLGVRASQSTLKGKRATAELLGRLTSLRAHIARISDRALLSVTAPAGQSVTGMDALEMDQYSELHEVASILREAVDDLDDLARLSSRHTSAAEAMLKQQAGLITALGSSIRAARVMPVSRLMPGLRRIVRTLSGELGKAVVFRVLSEAGKLDRDSHACCQIILEHMVRNALDHGIEPPAERLAAGKPDTGVIKIDVRKQGSDYIVSLSDDGRGIDPARMRAHAASRGLDIDLDNLSDRDAQRLIFHKGFSTASQLSEISGRGVGMDIVMEELRRIGGDIEIDSEVGRGTRFNIRIPSNISVNGALLVTAGEASYAIPFDGLIGVEHVPTAEFYQAVERQSMLPLLGLACEPGYLATLCSGAMLPEQDSWGPTVPVIVAGSGERHMAIAVDDVEQALELVIRSLGSQFANIPGVTGATTSADGRAIVALNLNALVASQPDQEARLATPEVPRTEQLLVMVVDDSRTQRMVATNQLHNLGVETVTAENGLAAMELLHTAHRLPDIILLDVEMPLKDGIQTLREIRRSSRCGHIPVIMVTSRTGPKHRALAEQAGCNGYMGKPFNFPLLVEQIAQLTGRPLSLP